MRQRGSSFSLFC